MNKQTLGTALAMVAAFVLSLGAAARPCRSAPPDGGARAAQAYRRTLPGGVTVELVAVSNPFIEFNKSARAGDGKRHAYWWQPGGALIEAPDFRRSRTFGDGRIWEFVLRVEGAPAASVTAALPGHETRPNAVTTTPVRRLSGETWPDAYVAAVPLDEHVHNVSLAVRVATGEWKDASVQVADWGTMDRDTSISGDGPVVFTAPRQAGDDVEVAATYSCVDSAVRVVVSDKKNVLHVADVWPGGDGDGLARRVFVFRNMRRADMGTLKFQVREYDRHVTFENVVVAPDHALDALNWTRREALFGKPAPELRDIKGWKNGGPITLSQLRGKVVLLDFWHYQCGSCILDMPKLMELHDRYKDRGLVVIGVHAANVGSIEAMDRELAGDRERIWKGRDLPFLVALDGGGADAAPAGSAEKQWGATTAAYGVTDTGWPSTFVIGRDGTLLGEFYPAAKDAPQRIEQLLSEGQEGKR